MLLFFYGTVVLWVRQDPILTWETLRKDNKGLTGNKPRVFSPQLRLVITHQTVQLDAQWSLRERKPLDSKLRLTESAWWSHHANPPSVGKIQLFFVFFMVTHYFGIFSQMSHPYGSNFSLAFYYFKKYCFAYVKTKDKYLCLVNLLFIYFFQEVKYQITLKTDLRACAENVFEYYSVMHLCVFVQRFKKMCCLGLILPWLPGTGDM